MEMPEQELSCKRRKCTKCSFLTTSKKCNRYRESRDEATEGNPDISYTSTSSDSEEEDINVETVNVKHSDQPAVFPFNLLRKTRVLRCA